MHTFVDDKRTRLISKLIKQNGIEYELKKPTDTDGNILEEKDIWFPEESLANMTLGPVDVFDHSVGEPAAVLKSFWPFLRGLSKDVPTSEWVGCGILDFRALFASTLGSAPDIATIDNRHDRGARALTPTKFVIFTKGEPDRGQIGRIVERLLSLEARRLVAFKNIGAITNSSIHLASILQSLDDILKNWSTKRDQLRLTRNELRGQRDEMKLSSEKEIKDSTSESPTNAAEEKLKIESKYYGKLSKLNEDTEDRLIEIGKHLEEMSPAGSGHLQHSIKQAQYYISEFRRLTPSLEIGNIDGWINYSQFSDRDLNPTFNLITLTADLLESAQARLEQLTSSVQVSALIVQSDATRRNTEELRAISVRFEDLNESQLQLERALATISERFRVPRAPLKWIGMALLALVTLVSAEIIQAPVKRFVYELFSSSAESSLATEERDGVPAAETK